MPRVAQMYDMENRLMDEWQIPSLLTEMYDCPSWNATAKAKIGHLFWEYSPFCNTGPAFGNRKPVEETFG